MTTSELKETFGDLNDVRAMTIGFGNFECNDPDQRDRPGRRRTRRDRAQGVS